MNMKDITDNPELQKALKEIEGKPLMEGAQILLPIIQKMNLTPEILQQLIAQELTFQNPLGTQRLNPMYEAKIVERVQFDGDAPELRTGPMSEGAIPAVPVRTQGTNPALIGGALKTASEQVQGEMKILAEKTTEIVSTQPIPDPKGYQRGQLPTIRQVEEFSLLDMDTETQRENTWRFISTTQGRTSAISHIEIILVKLLTEAGYTVQVGEANEDFYAWTIDISSGQKATLEKFDYINVVSKVFFNQIKENFQKNDLIIKVFSVNTVDIRQVGWSISVTGERK